MITQSASSTLTWCDLVAAEPGNASGMPWSMLDTYPRIGRGGL